MLRGNQEEIRDVIDTIHPADILDILHEDEEGAKQVLQHLSDEVMSNIIYEYCVYLFIIIWNCASIWKTIHKFSADKTYEKKSWFCY